MKSVRSLWEIQTLGMWAWSFLEMQESPPVGSLPAAHFLSVDQLLNRDGPHSPHL